MTEFVEIKLEDGSEEGTKAVVAQWLKQVGDAVEQHDPIIELETDKVMMEMTAAASGVLKEIIKQEGEDVETGEVLGKIEVQVNTQNVVDTPSLEQQPIANETNVIQDSSSDSTHKLSPAVRRLIREHELDINQINGSGKNARVTKEDVLTYLKNKSKTGNEILDLKQKDEPEQDEIESNTIVEHPNSIPSKRVTHDTMRRRIAEHMVDSLLNTSPHVTSVFEADLSAIAAHRQANKSAYLAKGIKLSYTSYFIYAAVEALQAVPQINSRFHEDALEIFTDINIGIGTALADKGLVVPVIHQAQTKKLEGIATNLQMLTEKARQGKLQPSDMQKGTFTISNHGVSGSLLAAPIIINQPQSAILGIGKLEKRVVVREVDGQETIQIRPMVYVTLTIDHRVLDAYQTNLFLTKFVDVIESWE